MKLMQQQRLRWRLKLSSVVLGRLKDDLLQVIASIGELTLDNRMECLVLLAGRMMTEFYISLKAVPKSLLWHGHRTFRVRFH